jgi:tetratricopeptide (TPR) repeat protein
MDEKNILQSWKEISSYLGRNERTCRRWEKEYGLPVYRMDGSPRASVFAYKEELDRWLDALLHEKEIASKKSFIRSKKNLIIILSLSIIVISILAVALWKILSPKTGVSQLPPKPSLAVLYFRNKTGDDSLDYLTKGLCDLLISDLSQSKYLNVLPEDMLFLNLRSLKLLDNEYYETKDLAKFAEQAQVDNIVFGNIIKSGEKLRVNPILRKTSSGENIAIESVDCASGKAIFSLVDEISRRIKAQLIVPPDIMVRGDIDKEMESLTTGSIEAYRYYIEGRQLFRKGQAMKSAPFFEKAIDIDPEFAMAYQLLARCYWNLPGNNERAKECMKKAFELSHHLPERERLQIQAHYYRNQDTTWDEAIRAFQELLRIYPDDYYAKIYQSALYRSIEDWDKIIELLQKNTLPYYSAMPFALLRRALRARGDYEDALKVVKDLPVDLFPFQYSFELALNFFYHGKFDLALYETEKMLEQSENYFLVLRLKGDIYLLKDDWIRAEECYKNCLNPRAEDAYDLVFRNNALTRLAILNLSAGKFDKAISYIQQGIKEASDLGEQGWLDHFHLALSSLYLEKGNIKGAAEECQKALDNQLENPSARTRITALYLKGHIALKMNNRKESRIIADELRKAVDNWLNPKLMRYYYHLIGHICLEENSIEDAIAYFEKAISLLPYQSDHMGDEHAPFYDSLALAFFRAKDYENARKWYEKILDLTLGRIDYGDIYAKSFFMLGKIYEQKGWKGKAIESYQKFLDLWKDADPDIPEIEDARRRLTALQN